MTIQELRENFTTIPTDSIYVVRGGPCFNDAQWLRVASRFRFPLREGYYALSLNTLTTSPWGFFCGGVFYLILMNRFLISFLIGALLAVITAGIFLPQKDDGTTIIAE